MDLNKKVFLSQLIKPFCVQNTHLEINVTPLERARMNSLYSVIEVESMTEIDTFMVHFLIS